MLERLFGPESLDRSEYAEKNVLDDLLGVLDRGDQPVSPPKYEVGVSLDEFPECRRRVRSVFLNAAYE